MIYNPNIHHRRSIRLKGYDYAREGLYFINLCTYRHDCLFGEIKDEKIELNNQGKVVRKYWLEIPLHYPNVELDEFVIMLNHIHGIIGINEIVGKYDGMKTVGAIVRGFKIGVTKILYNIMII